MTVKRRRLSCNIASPPRITVLLVASFVYLVCTLYMYAINDNKHMLVFYEVPGTPNEVIAQADIFFDGEREDCSSKRRVGKRRLQDCAKCSEGKFKLPGWFICRSALTCDDTHNNVRITRSLYSYGHHQHYEAFWEDFKLHLVCRKGPHSVSGSDGIVNKLISVQSYFKLVGFCPSDSCAVYFQDADPSWLPLVQTLTDHSRQNFQHWYMRLVILYRLLEVLSILHAPSMLGVYVMCDSDTVEGILSKFVVSERGQVQVAHVDGFALVRDSSLGAAASDHACAPSVAALVEESALSTPISLPPELLRSQLHGYSKISLDEPAKYSPHSIQRDVWSIPDVSYKFLRPVQGGSKVLDYLEQIHQKCKLPDPDMRPSMDEIKNVYMDLLWEFVRLPSSTI